MPISFDPALGYTQNFDSLPSSGSSLTWANDSTLTGWSLFRQPAPGTAITTINADSGASTSGSFVSYGMAGSTDRSLGGLASGGAYFGSPSSGSIAGWLTFSATHSGPATIDSLQIAFDGEQWRNGGNTSAQTMVIEYGIGPSFDAVTTWVKPGGNFDWSAPVVGSTAAVVDGNLAGRVAGRGGVLSGLGWDAGETLWVRWVETNDSGSDHGLAIDNFSLAVASAPSKPQLSVLASDAVGSESGGEVSFRFTRTGDTRAELTVPLTFTGAGVSAEDWAVQPPASITFAAGAASVDLVLKPVADSLAEGAETVTVTLSSSTDYELVSASASATLLDGASITSIAAIQGTGGATPVTANTVVSVEGRISAWFPGLGLFFIESDLVERDNDPKTSEGLAVYYGGGTSVILPLGAESVGDRVLLTGKVTEFNGLTQLGGLTDFDLLSPGTASDLAPPVVVTLPLASESDFEAYEGMRVTVRAAEGDLHVANTYTFARYGELTLYAGGVPQTYTQFNDPSVTGYAEYQAGLSARRIQIDDGSSKQNPSLAELNAGTRILRDADPVDAAVQSAPMGGTGASVNFVRVGDTADSVTGVLSYNFGAWEIHPTAEVLLEGSKRPRAPEPIPGAEIKLASFNVLNYFTTLGTAKFMTPAGNEIEARGATNEAEFAQQHAKIVNAMLATGAQVIGLNEIQNNGFGEGSAIDTLTDALNAAAGKDRFAYISSPASGSDAIMVAILYDRTVVSPLGPAAVPDVTQFDAFAANNRLPVAQTFTLGRDASTAFTVVVNHLKSKGSAVAGVAGDTDALDGQGQSNATRTAAADDLVAWLATNPTASPEARTVLLGDLNSYRMEDPIERLEQAGFTVQDAVREPGAAPSFSYVFDGLTGSLDHALTRGFAASEIAGATVFQINSPEQIALDYNDEFFPQDITAMDSNDMYRSSDHDPVILGLNLTGSPSLSFSKPDGGIDLASYQLAGRYALPAAPTGSNKLAHEASGVTYNKDTDTLFVVGDGGTSIAQVTRQGVLVDSMALATGTSPQGTYFYDTEGIAALGNGKFVMVEERDRELNEFTYQAGGTLGPASGVRTVKLGTSIGNVGLEGLSFDPVTGGFLFAKEATPQGVFQSTVDFAAGTASNGSPTTENSVNLFDPAKTSLASINDIFALANVLPPSSPDYSNLLLISAADGKLLEMNRQGDILGQMGFEVAAKNEGITMDPAGNIYVVGEEGGGSIDRPELLVFSPTQGKGAVSPTAHLYLSFDAPVTAGSGSIVISDGASDVRSIAVADGTQVSIAGATVMINPTAPLAPGRSYSISYVAGVFKDELGSAVESLSSGVLSFETAGDLIAPRLISTSPVNGAAGVTSHHTILTFDESVKAGVGVITISGVNAGGLKDVRSIPVDDVTQVTISGTTVDINPSADLRNGYTYTVNVGPGVIADLAGNAYPGFAQPNTLSFVRNSGTAAGPQTVIISEINSDAAGGDFFELYNYGSEPVILDGWKWDDDSASFADSGAGAFPTGTSIDAGARLIVVASNPDAFRTAWGLSSAVPVVATGGPGLGKGDAVVVFNQAAQAVTGLNYGIAAKTTSDGSIVSPSPASSGVTAATLASHAGAAFGATDAVSAVWDGVSVSAPAYRPATVGQLGAFSQPATATTIGSPGLIAAPEAADTLAPQLTAALPVNGAQSAVATAHIVLNFSEPVRAGSGNLLVVNGADASDTRTISVTDASQVTIAGGVVTINPTADLRAGAAYSVQLAAGVIEDLAGNEFAGLAGETALTFSVATKTPKLLITELNSNAAPADYFELYNYGDAPLSLKGWRWDDDSASFTDGTILPDVSIPAGGLLVVVSTAPTALATFKTTWGLADDVPVIVSEGPGLGGGDAVVLFNDAGSVVTSFNYSGSTKLATDGSTIGLSKPAAGVSFTAGVHAGPAFGGAAGVNGVSAVWDGVSTSEPAYQVAQAGVLDGAAQAGNANNIGSPGSGVPVSSSVFTLQLLHFADAEAAMLASQTAPYLAALVDKFEDAYANSITLAGGDNFIPSPFMAAGTDDAVRTTFNSVTGSTVTGTMPIGAVDIAIHNLIGVQASAVGNHEFDLGSNVLVGAFGGGSGFAGAQFPYISSNLDVSGDSALKARFTDTIAQSGLELASTLKGRLAPSAVIEVNGEKIGLVGATTQLLETISSPSGTKVKDNDGVRSDDMPLLATHLQPVIDDLTGQGVDKIILLAHLQSIANEKALAPLLSGVDVILAAGSNTRLGDVNDVAVAFPGHAANFADTYPLISQGKDGAMTLIVNTDNEFTYLGRLVVDFDAQGRIVTESLAANASINGAYAATVSNVATAWGVAETALDSTAFATGTKGGQVKALTDAVQGVITVKDSNVYGYSEVYLEGERINVRNQETNLGSLSADANGYAAEQALGSAAGRPFVVSIKNGGGIRAQIGTISAPKADGTVDKLPPEGGVSQLDVENSLRFDNKLMAFDTTPEGLKAILEHGVASLGSQGRFPQIGGVSFAYDPDLPAGSRITDIALIDSESTVGLYDNGLRLADTPAKITVSTLNFLANGGDGYPMKANGENFRYLMLDSSGAVGFSAAVPETANYTATDVINTFVTSGFTLLGEQKAFETYMKAFHGTPLSAYDQADRPADLDTRIQNMNARSESILEESVFGMASTLKLTGAEISAFDPESGRLFVTSSAGLQVIKVGLDLKMTLIGTVALGSNDINSVAVKNGMVAVAVAAADKTQPGSVYLLDAGAELAVDAGVIAASAPLVRGVVAAGALPDMLTFTPDGMKILVANEGEQNAEGSNPEGSVTIINLEPMWAGTGEPTTATATFTAFNNQRDALKAEGVRLFAGEPGFETISVAQDLEPEYIAVSPDGKTAMVTLQENNAVGVLDIASASFRDIVPLGLKDFSTLKLDTNDKDGVPVLKTGLPVFGLYMPDAITAFTGADGKTYYAIANEGDDRDDFITPGETIRVGSSSYVLDPTVFPNAAELKSEAMLGRLTVSNAPGNRGDLDGDGDIDQIIAYGARSFSILNDQGQMVYDSGSLIEEAVARGGLFSSASPSTTGLFDDGRSDNKGPEPEGITVGRVEGRMMAFVGLERGGGGVMVYDVTDPTDVSFVQYLRNAADVSPEGLSFVPADLSPSGKSVLFVTNEVSLTVTAFEYQGIEPIVGTADDDVLIGTPGDDLFSGDAGDDVLIGLDGDDHAVELSEGDIFIGGLGQDRAHFDGPSAHYRVILATPGQRAAVQSVVDGMGDGVAMSVLDQGPLYAVTSRLPGRSGTVFVQAEQLQFGDADPVDPSSLVLNVGAGGAASLATAVAAAQPGDTIVVAAGHVERGAVVIDRDDLTLVLEGSGPALQLVLAEASSGESSTAAMTSALSLSTSASGVTRLTLMGHRDADVTGNSLDNVIIGNDGHNHIDGKGGNDTLIGQGGDDELRGGAGDDWLDGNEGWDRLFGGSGNDRLLADAGGDEDPIDGDRAADVMSGGSGNDLLIVATDNGTQVQMLGGSGRDLFRFMSLDDGRDDKGELLPATELSPLDVAAFIADLTAADGIDFSALRDSPQASAAPAGLDSSGALAGDLRFDFGQGSPNAGLQVVGLTPVPGSDLPVFDGAGRRSLVMGELKLALVSASDVNAAIQRGSDFSSDSSFGEASGFDSINTLLVELSPIYATIV